MATTPPSSLPPAIVLDASVAVSVTAREATTEAKASAEIALAEELTSARQTTLLTLDVDMPRQARNQAPTVQVQVITP